MRHSLIGGLLVATAAVIGGPGRAHAQLFEGGDSAVPGRPEIIAPIPTGNPGGSGFYGFSSFAFYQQTFALGSQVIATRGIVDSSGALTGVPGTRLGSGAVALTTTDFGRHSYTPGWNVGLGYKFDNGVVVFFQFTQQLDHKYSAGASLVPQGFRNTPDLADSFLYAPVFNFPPQYAGPLVKTGQDDLGNNAGGNFYGIWNGASVMDIQFTQRFTHGEIGTRVPLLQTEFSRVYGLGGGKMAWFYEKFYWRTVATDVVGRSFPSDSAIYTNILSQRMYGPYIGCGHEVYLGKRFGLGVDLTAAALLDVEKQRTYYELGDKTTKAKRSRDDFNVVPNGNVDVNLMWYPIEGVQVKLGYTAQGYLNTKYMAEPVAFNFGALDAAAEQKGFRFVSGFTIGLGLFF